ncbi:hypothetical protein BGZ97_008361, partial [Linnemannia gamsii]
VGSAMEVEQEPTSRMQGNASSEPSHAEQQMPARSFKKGLSETWVRCQRKEEHCQKLYRDNCSLQRQLNSEVAWRQNVEKWYQDLLHFNREIQDQLTSVQVQNQDILANLEQLQDTKADLEQEYAGLKRRYNKKVESYKELDKNYMDLVRPLHVSGDDHSTIYSRLMHVRVSIESLVQKARGDGSANLNREAAVDHFKESKLHNGFPIEEASLESYHLNLYMESVIMEVLIDRFFNRPLGCIFDQSKEFEEISTWVDKRDSKIAARWRQQLCILIAHDVDAMERRREGEVSEAAAAISDLVFRVYQNESMSDKIRELCYNAFDLSFVMLGMESLIYPGLTPLGTPFVDTAMTTPQKSNPTGVVSL